MGELDAKRRAGFLPLLANARRERGQVFMTCTDDDWTQGSGQELQRWEVKSGTLKKLA
jgi:recombinational DNA repair ATPase RecF